ncbi:hypothetical protein OROGR_014985 [Orobanche gracilis]
MGKKRKNKKIDRDAGAIGNGQYEEVQESGEVKGSNKPVVEGEGKICSDELVVAGEGEFQGSDKLVVEVEGVIGSDELVADSSPISRSSRLNQDSNMSVVADKGKGNANGKAADKGKGKAQHMVMDGNMKRKPDRWQDGQIENEPKQLRPRKKVVRLVEELSGKKWIRSMQRVQRMHPRVSSHE